MYKQKMKYSSENNQVPVEKQRYKRTLALSSNLATPTALQVLQASSSKTLSKQVCYVLPSPTDKDYISYSVSRIKSTLNDLGAILWGKGVEISHPCTLFIIGYSKQVADPQIKKLVQRGLVHMEFLSPLFVLAAHTAVIEYQEEYTMSDANDKKFQAIFRPMTFIPRKIAPISHIRHVTLTGFDRLQRHGILHLFTAMGINCTENMQRRTHSHLICSDDTTLFSAAPCNRSKKYVYALQWGTIHLVNIQWVYYIAENGYESGCEANFPCNDNEKEKDEHTSNEPNTIIKPINTTTETFLNKNEEQKPVITPGVQTAKRQRKRKVRVLQLDPAVVDDAIEHVSSPMRCSQSQVGWGETEQEETCYLARD